MRARLRTQGRGSEGTVGRGISHPASARQCLRRYPRRRDAAGTECGHVEPEQVVATLARIKPQLEAQDFELVERAG